MITMVSIGATRAWGRVSVATSTFTFTDRLFTLVDAAFAVRIAVRAASTDLGLLWGRTRAHDRVCHGAYDEEDVKCGSTVLHLVY